MLRSRIKKLQMHFNVYYTVTGGVVLISIKISGNSESSHVLDTLLKIRHVFMPTKSFISLYMNTCAMITAKVQYDY